ncbi:MAG: PIN domain-containing protein [Bacteroidota bacterium]
MINLYIDTNVYLTFYHLSSEELEELDKLRIVIENTNDIILHLPNQTVDEFYRNRETKIADALKRFNEEKLNNQVPIMCKNYSEHNEMMVAKNEYNKHKAKLLEKLISDIESNNLAADRIISNLFDYATKYETNSYMLAKAKDRFDLGKPPGKDKSYGDAINWETLLKEVPDGEDLYFISDDKDFYSLINSNILNKYLMSEWESSKKSKIFSFRRISEFFKDKFPHIKFNSDFEKQYLIQGLSSSRSFVSTRRILNKLCSFEDFSINQLNEILKICIDNNQIYWIGQDYDIEQLIRKILDPYIEQVDKNLLYDFDDLFKYYNLFNDDLEDENNEDSYGEMKY